VAGIGALVLAASALLSPSLAQSRLARPIRVVGRPIAINPQNPRDERFGDFAYAGGLHLTSPDTSLFGGLSDLKVSHDGALTSETDEGSLLRAHVRLDARGRLAGLDRATIEPLTGIGGKPLPNKGQADAEGMAVWPNGDLMISFERNHRIWLYPHAGGDPRTLPMPAISMPANQGMEALALAPSQGPDAYWVGVEGGSIWLCRLKAPCRRWSGFIAPPLLFRLTALAETPQGELAILHHSWNPLLGTHVHLSIVTIPRSPAGPSRVVDRLELGPQQSVDNFEGMAALPAPAGGVRFYLISDDNFADSQRTLLEAFDWTPRGRRR
jgi:hypothetical protein